MFKINITAQLKKMKIKNLNFKNFAVAILAIIFASCSSSENTADNTPTPTQYILPRKISSGSKVTIINYNGNKLTESSNSPTKKNVTTYTGDFITRQESFLNGVSDRVESFTYENGKLKTFYKKEISNVSEYTTTYTHNATDITFIEKAKDVNTNIETTSNTGQIFITNGNITKTISTRINGTATYVSTTTFEYDSKNNATINILGFNLFINDQQLCSKNNYTKITTLAESTLNGIIQPSDTYITTVSLAYNPNNYVIERESFRGGLSDGKTTYEY